MLCMMLNYERIIQLAIHRFVCLAMAATMAMPKRKSQRRGKIQAFVAPREYDAGRTPALQCVRSQTSCRARCIMSYRSWLVIMPDRIVPREERGTRPLPFHLLLEAKEL